MSMALRGSMRGWKEKRVFCVLKGIFTTDYQFQSINFLHRFDRFLKSIFAWLRRTGSVLIVATFISLVCGLLINERALLATFFLACMTRFGLIMPKYSVNAINLKLFAADERLTEGESTTLTISAESQAAWPVAGISLDAGLVSHSKIDEAKKLIHLPVCWRSRQRITYIWKSEDRGVYPSTEPELLCSFPFQLKTVKRPVARDFRVFVHPKRFIVPEMPDFPSGIEDSGSTLGNRKGYSGETVSLRPYRQGDDPRRIHWPQTARTGALVVKEQQSAIKPRISVQLGNAENYRQWKSEWSVRLAASLIMSGIEQGWECELIFGETTHEQRLVRNCRREHFLDALAAFGNSPDFIDQHSEPAATGIQPDRLYLKIKTALTDFEVNSHFDRVILLGEEKSGASLSEQIWKAFFNEESLSSWLKEKA